MKSLSQVGQKNRRSFANFLSGVSGTVLVAFAILVPVVVGSAGMALDLGEAYLVRQRLAQALDASTLAGASSSTDPDEIEEKVQEFFDANYPENKIGTPYDLDIDVTDDQVTASANADFNTNFMRIFGVDKFTVSAKTVVSREVQGLEVALVLDNTGSMSSNNNIQTLRTAASNFVDVLFDKASSPEDIKIGLVPYSSSVNVGSYGLGYTPDGLEYASGRSFVVDQGGNDIPWSRYTTNHSARNTDSANWYGCIIANNDDGWDENSNSNDPYPNDVTDNEGPWELYSYGQYQRTCTGWGWSRTCTTAWQDYYQPNYNCPYTPIMPLSSDEDALKTAINTMQAHGYTYGNVGMEWGYRLLSPAFPFQEGASFDDPRWRKAVVMMTDGMNTMESNYSYYWRTDNHNITPTDLNNRFAEVCDDLKAEGVLVYTVTFTSGVDESTKDYYRNCATSPAQYYDAPSQADLLDVFVNISKQLANLHISQ